MTRREDFDLAAALASCPPDLRAHMDRTAAAAARLAARWGGSPTAAYFAGSVHDAFKRAPLPAAAAWLRARRVAPAAVDRASIGLLHGWLAAAVLEEALGVTDPDVLDPLRYHTTGRPGMTANEAALFVADQVEPGRAKRETAALRRAARGDMASATLAVLRYKVGHLIRKEKAVHPRARAALEHYER